MAIRRRRRRERSGIDDMLAAARRGLSRISVFDAADEVLRGEALLVDIRPFAQRAAAGEVHPDFRPLVVERNVLEWRFDPGSETRLPVASYDLRLLVLCQEGYASSLAAAVLRQLGLTRATDVVGGFAAWRDAGLPVAPRPNAVPTQRSDSGGP